MFFLPNGVCFISVSFFQTMLTAISMSAIATNGMVPGELGIQAYINLKILKHNDFESSEFKCWS